MIKVAFITRPNLYTSSGGDTVQVISTAKYLRKMGVHVDIKLSHELIHYAQYDLIHFFNIIDCEDLIGHALKSATPYLVSTIYVDYREFDRYHRKDLVGLFSKFLSRDAIEYMKTTAKFLIKGEPVSSWRYFTMGHKKCIQYLIRHASCLLPNSHHEYERLAKDYEVSQKYVVVPNAVDPEIFNKEPQQGPRDLIVCAARIEGRKNQLNLIKAIKGTDLDLVLAGDVAPNQADYGRICAEEANTQVKFAGHLTQDELLALFNKSRVHALPSWFETTGLSSLEAGVMGCNIVVGDRGDVREYFGDKVSYCDPGNPDSIRNAILEAYNKPVDPSLRAYILTHFTWEKAARETLSAYELVLKNIKS